MRRKDALDELSASEKEELIREWISGYNAKRNKKIMKRNLIDGDGYEAIAEEFDLSRQHVKTIITRYRRILCEHIDQKSTKNKP
jgi:DNA-directed RNA polymerase specialized sigma24 family protein